jgi:hypothetical protein
MLFNRNNVLSDRYDDANTKGKRTKEEQEMPI